MKIKKLILQNINSLYGKWEIDFDCEQFRQNGIFAITGKTGSGKSSILDAMCLALYGTTPRLNKDTGEAVSRGCSECMCELTFYDTKNREWIATFGYEMISKGPNKGKMKSDPFHKLVCDGKTEADKTSKVRPMIEEITGLDVTRFCRAVLLAQGSFDAFLNAGKDNGEILERITGTGIYSRIADKLRERCNNEKSILNTIEAQFAGITIMSDTEAQQLNNEIAVLNEEISRYTAEQEALNLLKQKFKELALHTRNLEKCSEDEKSLSDEEQEFAAKRQRFEAGKKVLEADEKFQPLKELLKQQTVTAAALLKNEQLLKDQESLLAENSKKLEEMLIASQKFEAEFTALSGILTAVNQLDTIIKTLESGVAVSDKKRRAEAVRALACRRETSAIRRQLAELKNLHSEATAYLAAHPNDGELSSLREICAERLENFKKSSLESAENRRRNAALMQEITALQKSSAEQEKFLSDAVASFNKLTADELQAKQDLTAILAGCTREHWQTLLDTQEKCYQQAVTLKSLEAHRKQLKDGEACPLCGAKEHPFAAGNIPEPEKELEELQNLKQRLTSIAKAEKTLQDITAGIHTCANTKLQYENALDQLKIQLEAKSRETAVLAQAEEKCQCALKECAARIDQALEPFGLSWDKEKFSLSKELDKRVAAFEKCMASQALFAEKSAGYQNDILRLHTELKAILANCRTHKAEWQRNKLQLAEEKNKRLELFGTKDPAIEAAAAEAKRKELAAQREAAQNAFTESSTNRLRTAEDIEKQKAAVTVLAEQIISARENFIFACRTAGVTEDEFHACVLPKEEMTLLAAKDADLKARRNQLAETRQNCEKEIKLLTGFLADKKSKEEVDAELQTVSEQLNEKNQLVGGLRQKLAQDAENKQKMAEQHKKLLEQQKVMEVWTRLYELIGVKDRFQRFAQGITLEHLLVLANLELEKLSGRYRLLRSQTEELGIDVADKDQGDEIRSCKTLSGGERFLVSLALALGLSQMAGEKIRVDSLFLDEGFGTLDAETLETALEALSNLRNRGKLVGVISHVSAFSEKIPCIIEVNKSGGGRSTLSGPGVRQR